MPAKLNIDRDQVKMLVLAVGCTQAAKETGIPLNTILAWSARGKWLKPEPKLPPTVLQPVAIHAINPVDALANVLSERLHTTKLGLSKYAADAAQELGDHPAKLKVTRAAKDVADVARSVWPVPSTGTGSGINLELLCDKAAVRILA